MKVSHDAQASELGLAEIFAKAKDAVRRRWLVLLLVAAAVFAAGVAVVLMLPPNIRQPRWFASILRATRCRRKRTRS
jgi:hypothetical protein